jgi:hypothetical protein
VHEAGRLDGAAGRHQRLTGDLPAEDPLGADGRAHAAKRRLPDLAQIEHFEQLVDGRLAAEHAHRLGRAADDASTREPSWCTRSVLVEPGALGGLPATTTT